MLKSKIFLISLLMLFMTACFEDCDNPTTPEPPEPPETEYVDVEVKYQRVDDDPNCPILHPDDPEYDRVLLKGSISDLEYPENKMEKIGDGLFFKKLTDVRANYPYSKYSDRSPYTVYVYDNFFENPENPECIVKAHLVWLNGKLMEKIKSGWKKEYLLVRIDEYGEAHEVDK